MAHIQEINPFAADEGGSPIYRGPSLRLPNGGAFDGWYEVKKQSKPFSVALNHQLGTNLYAFQFWFWGGGGDAKNFHSWMGRSRQPNDAGPVEIITTSNHLYFHFEPNKPIFSMYDETTGSFRPVDIGWIGALVIPG